VALQDTPARIVPSTYCVATSRRPSARSVRDMRLAGEIRAVHEASYGVCGVRKVHAALNRSGTQVARCAVERLMRAQGLQGVARVKTRRTAISAGAQTPRPSDLVRRQFAADAPNRLWVADITYVRTFQGWVYAAFVLDVFSRDVVGWQVATTMHTALALDALDMGLWARRRAGQDASALIHHGDRGVQYRALRYTERLAEADAVASVGSKGDSYDNAIPRGLQLAVQSRAHPQQGALVRGHRRRGRGRGVRRLVQPPAPAWRARPPAASRGRDRLLGPAVRSNHRGRTSDRDQITGPPPNPGRFSQRGLRQPGRVDHPGRED